MDSRQNIEHGEIGRAVRYGGIGSIGSNPVMKERNTLISIMLLTQATELMAVHILWYNFPPLAYEDQNGVSILPLNDWIFFLQIES